MKHLNRYGPSGTKRVALVYYGIDDKAAQALAGEAAKKGLADWMAAHPGQTAEVLVKGSESELRSLIQ